MKNMILYVSDEEAKAIDALLSDTEERDNITAQELDRLEHQGPIRHLGIHEHAIRIRNALSDMNNALGRHNVMVYTYDDVENPVKAIESQMQRLLTRMHTAHDRIDREIRELNVKAQGIDNGEHYMAPETLYQIGAALTTIDNATAAFDKAYTAYTTNDIGKRGYVEGFVEMAGAYMERVQEGVAKARALIDSTEHRDGEPRDPHDGAAYTPLWTEPEECTIETARYRKDKNRVNRMNRKDILILLATLEAGTVTFDEQYRDYDEADNGYTEDHMEYIAKTKSMTHKIRALVHSIDIQTDGAHE